MFKKTIYLTGKFKVLLILGESTVLGEFPSVNIIPLRKIPIDSLLMKRAGKSDNQQ